MADAVARLTKIWLVEFYHQEELRIDREKAEAAIQAVRDYEARLLREDKEMAEQAIRLAKAEEEKSEVAKQLAIEAEEEKKRLAEQAKLDEAAAKEKMLKEKEAKRIAAEARSEGGGGTTGRRRSCQAAAPLREYPIEREGELEWKGLCHQMFKN